LLKFLSWGCEWELNTIFSPTHTLVLIWVYLPTSLLQSSYYISLMDHTTHFSPLLVCFKFRLSFLRFLSWHTSFVSVSLGQKFDHYLGEPPDDITFWTLSSINHYGIDETIERMIHRLFIDEWHIIIILIKNIFNHVIRHFLFILLSNIFIYFI